jgi:UTP--glucose-1-phosphate uridylyltransferase
MRKPVTKAVFPVAGMGTRFLPATKAMPKEMLPIVDKPLIQYAVEEARDAGIEEIIFVTGRGKAVLLDHFDHSFELEQTLESRGKEEALSQVQDVMSKPGQISSTRQQQPLGLGHAVWCARHFIVDEPFAVLLADDLIMTEPGCLKQIMEVYSQTGGNIVVSEEVPPEHTNRYGILDVVEDDGRLARAKGLVKKPEPDQAPSNLCIIGRHILQPEIFDHLSKQEQGAGGGIQLTDALAKTIDTILFHGLRFDGSRFDCGSKLGFLEAQVAFALARDYLSDGTRQMLKKYE